MSDNVFAGLMLEQFRAIRRDLAGVREDTTAIKARMQSVEEHMTAIMRSLNVLSGGMASLEVRVERIERRLDLVDAAPR